MTFAGRVVVMDGGRIEQIGRPRAKREPSPNRSVAPMVPRGFVHNILISLELWGNADCKWNSWGPYDGPKQGRFHMAKATDITSSTTELYNLLEPLDPAQRTKVIKAALTLLGDDIDIEREKSKTKKDEQEPGGDGLRAKARTWARTNSITEEQLHHVFHLDGGKVEVIAAEAPGKTGKQKTVNAYILTGLAQFLQTGEAKFDDKTARAVCKAMGCLDESNHAYNLKGKGNALSGSKDSGWTLTGPGLKAGAELVKGLAGE